MSYALQFLDVSKTRGDSLLFSGLSFTLKPGELLWIHGINGSGKTTILRLAAGLSRPTQGEIKWTEDAAETDPRRIIAYQGHKDSHKDDLYAREELQFWSNVYASTLGWQDLAARVGLAPFLSVKCSALSAGQKRRLALCRLMLGQKPVWILDEPTAAMDGAGYQLVDDIMAEHLEKGGAILAASHNSVRDVGGKARRIHLESSVS